MTDLISSGLKHTSFLKTCLYYFPLFDKSCVIHQSQFTGNLALFVWLPWHQTACGTAFKTNTVLPKQLSMSALQRALVAAAAVIPPRHRPKKPRFLGLGIWSSFLNSDIIMEPLQRRNMYNHGKGPVCLSFHPAFVLWALLSPLREASIPDTYL